MKKRTLSEYLKDTPRAVLNLGCGQTNIVEFFGMDIVDADGVDMVANAEDKFPIKNDTFSVVYARDILEHIIPQKNIHVMEEIYRILKPGGYLEFLVPSTDGNNTAAFQDPTHYSFWNEMKFRYFYNDKADGSFRHVHDVNCHFLPTKIETFFNEWNLTYVKGILQKPEDAPLEKHNLRFGSKINKD